MMIPCQNCILFPLCQNKVKITKKSNNLGTLNISSLSSSCKLLQDYLKEETTIKKISKNLINNFSKDQGVRYVIISSIKNKKI
jgi:hypothetical protein